MIHQNFARLCRVIGNLSRLILALVFSLPLSLFAAWDAEGVLEIPANVETTITLRKAAPALDNETTTAVANTLWLLNQGSELLLPETVNSTQGRADVAVFPRGEGTGEILVHDPSTATTSTVPWKTLPAENGKKTWIPRLEILGTDKLPVAYANQKLTATLTLTGGTGVMPAAAHIKALDHRGRLVMARNYSTFDLLAGQGMIFFPAAGIYDVSLQLIDDPVTSLPQAKSRNPQPIPFGKTAADVDPPVELADDLSTDTVVGTIVTLEHVPTTATLAGEDRLQISVFGKHSREIQRNRWPFGISGANLMEMPVRQHKTLGAELLQWQRRLGSSFAPVTVQWADVQLNKGLFSWSQLHSMLTTHRAAMVRPVVTITGRASWNDSLPTDSTETLDAWTSFTRRLSDKYMKLMWGFQVWDRPEDTWENPKDYATVIDATLTGFQMRNGQRIAVPPVIVGGTRGMLFDYLNTALTSETAIRVSLSFDFLPENGDQKPEAAGFPEAIDRAAEVLRLNNAPGRQISVATGYANGPGGVTAEVQANYLVRTYVLAMSKGIYKVMWHGLFDKSKYPWAENAQDRMGLLNNALVPKPSGVAYNIMSYMMSGATLEEVTTQGSATVHKFNLPLQDNKWPGTVYVAWTESPDQVQDIRLEMTHGGGVYALDYLGAEVRARNIAEDSANSIKGSYQIPVGFEPVFIWDAGKPGQKD